MSTGSIPISVDGARNLLAYSRDSAERLLGVFGQDEEIREWADFHGYEIVGFCRDVKVHGQSPIDEREGLSGAVRAIQAGQAGGLVVRSLDRLARDFPIQDDAMHRVWGAGGRVFSCDYGEWRPDKPGSPQWRLRRDYARMAEDELHALLARLQNGRRRKIARGGYGGGHRIRRRYGVELVSIQGRWEYRPVPAEQLVIKRICSSCPDGTGYSALAKTLNAEGVPTAAGAPWSAKTVRDLALRGPDRLVAIPAELLAQPAPLEWVRQAAG